MRCHYDLSKLHPLPLQGNASSNTTWRPPQTAPPTGSSVHLGEPRRDLSPSNHPQNVIIWDDVIQFRFLCGGTFLLLWVLKAHLIFVCCGWIVLFLFMFLISISIYKFPEWERKSIGAVELSHGGSLWRRTLKKQVVAKEDVDRLKEEENGGGQTGTSIKTLH